MSWRSVIARLALVLVATVAVLVGASDTARTDPAGAKVAAPPAADFVAAPASTQLGTWILTLLLLSASSIAMLGGGLWQRVMVGSTHAAGERPAEAPEARAKRAPKNKSKCAFSPDRAPRERRARRGWNVSWRNANQVKPRRRGIGGCRGVR